MVKSLLSLSAQFAELYSTVWRARTRQVQYFKECEQILHRRAEKVGASPFDRFAPVLPESLFSREY